VTGNNFVQDYNRSYESPVTNQCSIYL